MHARLNAAVAFLACTICVCPACAQDARGYPVKPVRVLTVGAGSQSDSVTRIVTAKLAALWKQPVVVENRPGAGGAMSAAIVAKAAPDGYTLLLQSSQFAVNAALNEKLPYDVVKDFSGIAFLGGSALVLITSNATGAKTVKEFVAYAKAQAKPVLFSSAGAGSSSHMNAERFKLTAGIPATHVGFKASPEAALEVAAGRVHYAVVAVSVVLPMIRSGKSVPLAVISPRRSAALPEVPLMTETYPNYGRDGSFTLAAPAGTPLALRQKIHKDVLHVIAQPDVKERFSRMDFDAVVTGPEDFERLLRHDLEIFRKIGKQAGLIAK
ncbi:MAG: tripartite tricarboxylate transporter substrate binding protein [Betaproteobacteria bacterium]|nr:tripartite tricarboxylate transporter substrate binding protein [Betaproteobacteria bacterium]